MLNSTSRCTMEDYNFRKMYNPKIFHPLRTKPPPGFKQVKRWEVRGGKQTEEWSTGRAETGPHPLYTHTHIHQINILTYQRWKKHFSKTFSSKTLLLDVPWTSFDMRSNSSVVYLSKSTQLFFFPFHVITIKFKLRRTLFSYPTIVCYCLYTCL